MSTVFFYFRSYPLKKNFFYHGGKPIKNDMECCIAKQDTPQPLGDSPFKLCGEGYFWLLFYSIFLHTVILTVTGWSKYYITYNLYSDLVSKPFYPSRLFFLWKEETKSHFFLYENYSFFVLPTVISLILVHPDIIHILIIRGIDMRAKWTTKELRRNRTGQKSGFLEKTVTLCTLIGQFI